MSAELVVLGSVNVDLRSVVDRLPTPGETVSGSSAVDLLGGKGANQAVASHRLGRTTHFIGSVGDDARGRWARERLEAEGLDVTDVDTVPGPTGTAVVLVDGRAENMIVVSGGANMELRPDTLADRVARHSRPENVLLMQLEIPIETVAAAAADFAGTVILNPAPAAPIPQDLWSSIDVIVPNLGELATMTSTPPATTVDGIVAQLRSLPVGRAVVTWGARGCVVLDEDAATHIAAPMVDAVDTTGAGDAFCGALADGLAASMSLVDAASRAATAASMSTLLPGAQTSPTASALATRIGPPTEGPHA